MNEVEEIRELTAKIKDGTATWEELNQANALLDYYGGQDFAEARKYAREES